MDLKYGLYLFPSRESFIQYGYYQGKVTEFGSATYGNQLVEFFDLDINKIVQLSKKVEQLNGIAITEAISEFGDENSVWFLIKLMTNENSMKAYDFLSEHSGDDYKALVLEALNSVVSICHEMWTLADYYCERIGSAEERFDLLHAIEKPFTDIAVEEIISARKPGREFFLLLNENDYSFPYTHAYRFTDLKNYVQFIFLNMMQYCSNFSKCNYCYKFFIPKTKKLTRFCDRVDAVSGKTCKEIAPTVFRNDDLGSTKIMKEYNRALQRNYKRMCRAEERLTYRQSEKDIDFLTYSGWRDRVLNAMRLWKGKEISDAEFLNIVKELD